MYTGHFGLNEKPFSISPDPRYLYLSGRHADALAHLLYGISESGGFIQLTGEVGTGKTTLIRSLFGQLPDATEIALILNPKLSTKQFLQSICRELDVQFVDRDTAKALIDRLNLRLLALYADNRRAVLIVDEAQTMSPELLEQVRLLTNLETDRRKLLQIILIGQPELREQLAQPSMRQIAQRITGRYHLEPLKPEDTADYVAHRLEVAGGRPGIFSRRAVRQLYRLSRGIPRLINVIADRSMLAAYTLDETRIGPRLVRRAAGEVFGHTARPRWWPWAATLSGLLLIGLGATRLDEAEPGALQIALADRASTPAETAVALRADGDSDLDGGLPVAATARANADGSTALSALLGDHSSASDAGWPELFALWGLDYAAAGEPPCARAEAAGLACLALNAAPLGELRRLARPARLTVTDDSGQTHHLVLTGLTNEHALLLVGGKTHRVPLADLTRIGFGEHMLLFRPAIRHEDGALREGLRGPGVVWLRSALEDLAGEALSESTPDLYDAGLAAAVRRYQEREGLAVDGIVGDRTLIGIQTDLGLVGVPLQTESH